MEQKDILKIANKGPVRSHIKYHSNIDNADYDLTHAIDFLCKLRAPVRVALDGEVIYIQDGITKNYGGLESPPTRIMKESEQDGNCVVLKHVNNEFSIYSHLESNQIQVKVKDIVKTGDLLGYCGLTGWSSKIHLHFMVFIYTKPQPAKDFESLDIRWKQT